MARQSRKEMSNGEVSYCQRLEKYSLTTRYTYTYKLRYEDGFLAQKSDIDKAGLLHSSKNTGTGYDSAGAKYQCRAKAGSQCQ